MCGVLALWLVEERCEMSAVRQALNRLSHRGPDGEGIWISDDARVALGHRRLSIIGPENGAQPIANEDGSVRIIVNGEIYGYELLRERLQERGHRFRTASDSEVILHLYEDQGIECLKFLRGEFVFVLWDARARRLVAARDRFGIKPLCYAQTGRGLFLASKASALFAASVPAAWDGGSFFHASSVQYVLPDRTLFRGIRQLPPASVLIARDDHVQIRRYWDPFERASDGRGEDAAVAGLVQRCRHEVFDAVRVRLRSDVPVCCHLSGGLDSSTVVGIAARMTGTPLDAYNVSFSAPAYDEREFARQAALHANVRLHTVQVTPVDVLQNLFEAVRLSEGLCINGHLPAKYLLHQRIHDDGYKVVLSGEGADEAFAGYGHLRVDHWRATNRDDLVRSLAATNRTSLGMMLPHGESLDLSGLRKRLGFVPAWIEAKATFGRRLHSLLNDDFLAEFRGRDPFGELVDTVCDRESRRGEQVELSTRLWCSSALANYILATLGDGSEMAHSVEGRVPFLDHLLWEFLREVPLNLKIRDTTEKFILREAVRDVVPGCVYRREKHPFDAPPLILLADASCRDLVHDLLDSAAIRSQPFFDPQRVRDRLAQLASADETTRLAWDPVIMTVLSTAALQQAMIAA